VGPPDWPTRMFFFIIILLAVMFHGQTRSSI
jgi:hypothetical protein